MILKRLIPLLCDHSEAGTCALTFSSRLRLPAQQLFLFESEKVERHSPPCPPPPASAPLISFITALHSVLLGSRRLPHFTTSEPVQIYRDDKVRLEATGSDAGMGGAVWPRSPR